jgi:bla regulator protein BlaR1
MIAHLWQSTLVAGVVWLITLALRGNRAHVRCWLWKAASLKFLLPFSLLVSLGAQLKWQTAAPIAQPALRFVVEQVMAPPVVDVVTPATKTHSAPVWPFVLGGIWLAGFTVVLLLWWRGWSRIQSAVRNARPVELDASYDTAGLAVMSSPWTFEPGVVGIWHPILLLPDGLADRLTPAQLNAIIAHELSHIRSHDNLAAALHMLVEAIFWFHPLVWWMERRLIAERERACDEAVLHAGTSPTDYAEGILNVCSFTQCTPVACVAGVSGADLRARIEFIVRKELGTRMTFARRVAVALVMTAVISVPILSGVTRIEAPLLTVGQEPNAPVQFEAAAVKPNKSGEISATWDDLPGGRFVATNATLEQLILEAYRVPTSQLVDLPGWTRSERYDINAKLEHDAPIMRGKAGDRQFALRSLLAERFKLVVHREDREFPMYALVMARSDRKPGPMLKPSSSDCSPEAMQARMAGTLPGPPPGVCGMHGTRGQLEVGARSMAEFAKTLSSNRNIGRGVIDRTGLTGNWDFTLTFAADPTAADANGPDFITALQEQLGLKLESIRGTMEVLVVDHVERLD